MMRKDKTMKACKRGRRIDVPLGYNWIIQDIRSIQEGSDFLDSYIQVLGNDLTVFEDIPMYKYYYRFFKPIKYHHPTFKDCEESFWDLFFQLVFAEGTKPRIIPGRNGVPELSFCFTGYPRLHTSEISLTDYKKITSDMAAQAFTKTGVEMLGMNYQKEYALTLPDDKPPLRNEIIKMFGYDDFDDIIPSFIKSVYRRIRNYDLQTLEYRLKNQGNG